MQVKSSGYQAEFGGSTGGVVNVVTKSGSNLFHGDAGMYFTNDSLCCDERPTLRLVLSGQNQSEYVTLAEDDYSRSEPFFQLGGPIVRDRLWFYGGYTPQIDDTNRTVTFRSNSQTSTYESKEKWHNLTGNITSQMTNNLRAQVRSSYSIYKQDGRLPAKDGSSNFATNFAGLGREQPNVATSGSVDYVAKPNLFLNAKAAYLSYDTRDLGIPSDNWITFGRLERCIPGRDERAAERLQLGADQQRQRQGHVPAHRRQRRRDVLRQLRRPAHVQGRRAVRAHPQRRVQR